ncbi:MAG: hypothetical protein CXR30_13195 [Geobacter sp.]|nr:MAG: hypothetical protein CXR30_13195 [Geobacter sp.]
MNIPQTDLSPFCNSAVEALKRAYEECQDSKAGSFILIAFNAIISLENEIGKNSPMSNRSHICTDTPFKSGNGAAAR